MDASGMWHKLKNYISQHRVRGIAAILLLLAELAFFFGTDALREEKTNFLTGEGSWDIALSAEASAICQEFVPEYSHLTSLSFRMDMTPVRGLDGTVEVSVLDADERVLFEKVLGYEDITNGAYTDVAVDLNFERGKLHYLVISCMASEETGYPLISVCGREHELPESRRLIYNEELSGQHLVSRYRYEDVLPFSKGCKAVLLCVIAAAGVMFGLPDNRKIRIAIGAALFIAMPYILGQRLELLTYNSEFYLPIAMKWNVGIIYALELIVLLVTHSPGISVMLTGTAVTALYSANYFMLMYRGTSLRMNDFAAAQTAVKVLGDYDLTPNTHLAMIWGILLVFAVFGLQTGLPHRVGKRDWEKRNVKWIALSYVVTIALAVVAALYGGHQLLYTDLLYRVGFAGTEFVGFDYDMIYAYNGYLVASCIEIQKSRIVRPEGYSTEAVERLLKDSVREDESAAEEEQPHVIFIMNESFADLRVLGGMELSQNNLSFFDSLEENTVKGWVNVSTLGGGTANSEFEAITGCSLAFLPTNYYPYNQALNRPIPSMVSQMKNNGYSTISIHPEQPGNWNRKNVYRYYGFDRMLWWEDFKGAETIHAGVSDVETYRRIMEIYEEREEGEKLFIFDLTIQNHGGYTEDGAPYAVTAVNFQEPQIDEFLSLIKISDEALAELVNYFGNQDEKVVICMFGDHQPWLSELITGTDGSDGSQSPEQLMKMYKTPFVIWANYDINEVADCDISTNYLGSLLMKTAGIPRSPYFQFLEQVQADYPIITVRGYVDSEGIYHAWGSEATEFPEYRILQYNYLFDTDTVEWGY